MAPQPRLDLNFGLLHSRHWRGAFHCAGTGQAPYGFRQSELTPLPDFPLEFCLRFAMLLVLIVVHVLSASKIPSALAVWLLARS
jgi:hypothetical protein